MQDGPRQLSRRQWLQSTGAAAAFTMTGAPEATWSNSQPADRKLPVAAVVTVYTPNSHADVIVGKILEGFEQDGGPGPQLELAAMYVDQFPRNDMSRGLAEEHRFPLFKSIDETLTLGTDRLAVAGVLSIGEHGNYPSTPDTNQHQYPRRRFFDGILSTFQRCQQVCPVFSDKHLAYDWADAQHMYAAARRSQVPFMAGSSVPVAWREPPVVLPRGTELTQALAVGYGGLEAYGFHALEALQCFVERRRGGESGVSSVRAVQGDEIWSAAREGWWSEELFRAALRTIPGAATDGWREKLSPRAVFYLIEYRDGLRATVAMANGVAQQFATAVQVKGQPAPLATWCRLQEGKPYGHFGYLVRAIDSLIHTGVPAYPVERTLLTTGILDAAMHSLAQSGARLSTPYLDITYQPTDWPFANQPT